jgi:hypothetical protein
MIVEPSKDDLDETLGLLMQVLNNPNMGDIPRDSALVMRSPVYSMMRVPAGMGTRA